MSVKKSKRKFLSICLVLSMLFQSITLTNVFASTQAPAINTNLIKNGDFSKLENTTHPFWSEEKPSNWSEKIWSGSWGDPKCSIEKIDSNNNDLKITINTTSKSRGNILSDKIIVSPNKDYVIKVRVKLDSVTGNNFAIKSTEYNDTSKLKDTEIFLGQNSKDWTIVEKTIHTTATTNNLMIDMVIGNLAALNTGIIWVDYVSVEEVVTDVPVENVSISPSEIKDVLGKTYKLNAMISPTNASNKNVSWESGDNTIATVTQDGQVRLLGLGTTQIKVTTEDGNKTAICKIDVVENVTYPDLLMNGDFELTEAVTDTDNLWKSTTKPQFWLGKNWKDDRWGDPEYSIEEDKSNKFLTINIPKTARGTIVSNKIKVNPNTNYELKGRYALDIVDGNNFGIQIKQYKANSAGAGDIPIFAKKGTTPWTDLVGQFYSRKETEYIEVVLMAGADNALTSGTISIDDLIFKEINVGVEKIEIEQEIYDEIGTEHQLNAIIKPSNATNQNIKWTSENTEIATVDENGKVSFKTAGSTQIKATTQDGNKEDICNVTVVNNLNIDEISLETNIKLELDDKVRLIPTVLPVGLKPKNLTWTSSNETIATVDSNGLVTSKSLGEVDITVTVPEEYGGKFAVSKIIIVPKSENLVPNGGFEKAAANNPNNPEGYGTWTPTGIAKQGLDTEQAYRGEKSYKIEAEIDTRTSVSLTNHIPITQGTYKLSIMVKTEDIVLSNGVRMRYTITKNDNSKIQYYSQGKKTITNGWEEDFIIFDAPENSKTLGIEVFFETGTGRAWVDNLKLQKWVPIEDLELPQEKTMDLSGTREEVLLPTITPSNALEKDLIWNTSNEKIVSVDANGKIKAQRPGTAIITVMTLNGKIKSNCNITVTGELTPIPATAITLDKTTLELKAGRTEKLKSIISPADITDDTIIWTSSDENIATVIDGRVTGKTSGTVTITAKTHNGLEASCQVNIIPYISDEFDTLRISWKSKFNNQKIIDDSVTQTQNLWGSMYKNPQTKYLWQDIVDYKIGVNITTTARRLRAMAIAVTMESSPFYDNKELTRDIVEATMWLYENTYSQQNLKYYEWFSWEIGIPQAINDIFSLLYENFTDEETNKIMNFIGDTIMPNPAYSGAAMGASTVRPSTGANLLDQTKSALMPAILRKQSTKIELCKTGTLSTLDYVTTDDGFYEDGSFIQHGSVPYTGSYGIVWLGGMADITEILAGTTYELDTQKLCKLVEDSFIDFIYNGAFMDMVRGRAIAKANNDDHDGGHSAINSIIRIANSSTEKYKNKFLSLCKYWILQDNCGENIRQQYTWLIDDTNIVAKKPEDKGKEYYNMNRSVYHRDNFAFGISKSSKNIQTFELTNGENQKGWYTGDGMTYVYNDDITQFDDMFWVTTDYYRMPGTTVDTITRTFGDYQNGDGETRPNNSWAGGTTDGVYGVSGMNVQSVKSDLKLNKSWFVFDDEMVSIGSDINSQSGRDIETIIEQRKIDGNNSFVVNGEQKSSEFGWSETLTNVEWAYLEGNNQSSSIGYYFPNKETIQAKRETRSGNYNDINLNGDTTKHTRNYMTMWKNHGQNPQGDIYTYSILPGKTPAQIEEYIKNPDIQIIAQTNDVHAVKEKNLGILAANFFADKQTTADYLTSYNNSSVMIKETGEYLELSVSDPTLANKNTIELELNKANLEIIQKPENVTVQSLSDTTKISIDVSGANKGQTFTIKFKNNSTEEVKSLQQTIDDAKKVLNNPDAKSEEIIKSVADLANKIVTFKNQKN